MQGEVECGALRKGELPDASGQRGQRVYPAPGADGDLTTRGEDEGAVTGAGVLGQRHVGMREGGEQER